MIVYLVIINIVGFILFAYDKRQAIRHKWRIRERTLFLCSLFGGAGGSWLAMYLFNHKTKKRGFVIGIPLILAAQFIICYAYTFWKLQQL